MGHTPRTVKDRVVQYPGRYNLVPVSGTTYDLVPVPGTVTESGTQINKAYLQPIEDELGKHKYTHYNQLGDFGIVDSSLSTTDFSANMVTILNAMGAYSEFTAWTSAGTYPNFNASIKAHLNSVELPIGDGSGTITIKANGSTSVPNDIWYIPNNTNYLYHGSYDNVLRQLVEVSGIGLEAKVADRVNKIAVYGGSGTNDPNTTQEALILTNNANSPEPGSYFHIRTYFYNTLTGNKTQTALKYNNGNAFYIRQCVNGVWTPWQRILSDIDFDGAKGTIQTPTYTNGKISQIVHKIGAATVRTDTFTYTATLITEVRTIANGNVTTYKYYFNADGSYNRTEVS